MKHHYLLTTLIVLFTSFQIAAQSTTSVYVTAHPDDWQLFMNPNAYSDVKDANNKVVFIHTTAGDAGTGTGNNNYYLAREEGSLRALRFMSNTFGSGAGLGANMNETTVTFNGHSIRKFTYRNIVAYFLRLPDGNPGGTGYALHNYASLQKLYNGTSPTISAVDGTATYTGAADLKTTLRSLVESEASGSTTIMFNSADHDATINPGDHSDHVYSSRFMQDVANMIGGVTLNLYVDYHTNSLSQNVNGDDYLVSAGTWGATASGLSDNYHSSTWDAGHNAWIGKQYFRTTTSASSTNVALNKPTTASSHENNQFSSLAVDNDYSLSSWWGANPYPQWWQVDLQSLHDINQIVVTNYYDGTRYYQYDVQASSDGTNWTTIADFNTNTTPATSQGNTFNINTRARYLRVNMNYNSANVGVHIVEFEAYGTPANLALNKPTTASSHETGSFSSLAVDSDHSLAGWWGASPYPQWWQVDLQDQYTLNEIVVTNYYDGTRYYQYDIQASSDGTNWNTIADFSTNTTPATSQGNTFNVNTTARYLRINMNYNSANPGVHIVEFDAYGTAAGGQGRAPSGELMDPASSTGLIVYPNPMGEKGDVTVQFDDLAENEKIVVEIINAEGKKTFKKRFRSSEGMDQIHLKNDAFSTGLNIINLTSGGETISKKIIKK